MLIEPAEQCFEEVGVPAGLLALDLDAAFAVVLPQQRQGHAPQPGQVLRRVPGPHPAVVLAEHYVEEPMDLVLDAPMAPYPGRQALHPGGAAADVVGRLVADLVPLTLLP